jgi:hypothetical protein
VYEQLPDDDSDIPLSVVYDKFKSSYGETTANEVLGANSTYDTDRQESDKLFINSGIRPLPQIVLNGVLLNMKEDIEQAVVSEVQEQTQLLQQEVYMGQVNDWTNLEEYFYGQPNIRKRYNSYVLSQKSQRIDLSYPIAGKSHGHSSSPSFSATQANTL